MAEGLLVVVPTIRRYDLLLELLDGLDRGTVKPTAYLVVDNGNGLEDYLHSTGKKLPPKCTVDIPGTNRGLSWAFNRGLRMGYDYTILANDDVYVSPNTIERFLEEARNTTAAILFASDSEKLSQSCVQGWLFCLLKREICESIGYFDERFLAYFEDADFDRRALLRGFTWSLVRGTEIGHHGSSSGGGHLSHESHEKYRAKWGGSPWHENHQYPPDLETFVNSLGPYAARIRSLQPPVHMASTVSAVWLGDLTAALLCWQPRILRIYGAPPSVDLRELCGMTDVRILSADPLEEELEPAQKFFLGPSLVGKLPEYFFRQEGKARGDIVVCGETTEHIPVMDTNGEWLRTIENGWTFLRRV